MKLRLPRRRVWRLCIYLVSLVLVLLAIDLVLVEMGRHVTPGYDTTRIIAPVLPDGSIDYLTVLDQRDGEGVSRDDNAVPLLLKAFGRQALPANQPPDGITDRLGMPHLSTFGNYFIQYYQFNTARGAYVVPDLLDPQARVAWPVEVPEKTREWVEANRQPLDLVVEATRRPRFFFPFYGGYRPQSLFEVLLPYLSDVRGAGDALLLRATMRLSEGDGDGSVEDLMAVHRLARLVAQSPTLVEHAVANALETAACRTDRAVAAGGKLSAQQSTEFAARLAKLPDLPSIDDCLDLAERFMILDAMQTGARLRPVEAGRFFNSVSGSTRVPPALFALIPVSYNDAMREANRWYDAALAALRRPTYRDRRDALQLWGDAIATQVKGPGISMYLSNRWMLALFIPALNRAHERQEIARMEHRLTQVAFALALYKADQGHFPPALSDLVPKYLSAVPLDSFNDKPLFYSPTAAGYTLYSVGPNMTDDGGSTTQPADDVVASQP